MTTPAESPGPGDEPGIPDLPAPRRPRRHRKLRLLALCASLLLLTGAGGAWYAYRHLDGNIRTDTNTARELLRVQSERPSPGPTHAENILIIGSDNRGDGNGAYGQDTGTQRSDTTILLHLTADRNSATAMSIPRDLMTDIPNCRRPDGSSTKARTAQFNWAFEFGGAACTIRTVEKMTGIRVDHHLVVDFVGFKEMVDAVGGVEVCVPHAVHDKDAHLDIPAGRQTLRGEQALGYVRARKGIGDGSDTQRMDRQQQFMASLVKKVETGGVLLNPVRLYPLLDAVTSSLTADPGLDSLSELYDLVRGLRKTPADHVRFLTVPREPYTYDHNRDQLVRPDADRLFEALREDRGVTVSTESARPGRSNAGDGKATSAPGSASPSATSPSGASPSATGTGSAYRGTTADRDVCGPKSQG